ncbi:MAG: hypothetical protein HY535_01020 [Chloroflexi bacterium]|nr:hypothetical protein [Chloroflexota bacterium]
MRSCYQASGGRASPGWLLSGLVAVLTMANVLLVGVPFGLTSALLTDTPSVGANAFSTRPDWEVPATALAKVLNGIGYGDYLRQGGTYAVCAQVTDGGNPPATPLSATANLAVPNNVMTTGATSVSLSSGSFTCEGASYNYQSGTQTADAAIAEGPRTFQVTATDGASNSATTSWAVTIDNTGPSPLAFATANGGATAGKMESGDTFTVTMSESTIDLNRIIAGWTGASTAVQVKTFNNNADFGGNDGLAVCNGGTGAQCKSTGNGSLNILGLVNLAATTYVTNAVTFNATLAWNSVTRVFTVTLGTCTAQCTKVTTGGSSTATFLPQDGATLTGGLRDRAGNGASGSATEGATHF